MKELNFAALMVLTALAPFANAAAAMFEMFPQEEASVAVASAHTAAAKQSTLATQALADAGSGVVRKRVVPHARRAARAAVADRAAYPFFANAAFTTTVTRVSNGFGGAEIVEGETADKSIRSFTIYTPEGTRHEIHGAAGGLVYVAASLPDGTMSMQEFDPSLEPGHCGNDDYAHLNAVAPPEDGNPLGGLDPQTAANIMELAAAGDTEVDLMLVFDTGAAAWAQGNAGGVAAMANSAVARMNTALADSLIGCEIRLVHIYLPDYTSNGNLNNALDDATGGLNGLGGIAAQRDACGADVVSFMIDTGSASGTTGLGWVNSSASSAFSACAVRSVNVNQTMTHEIGHNFGCGHSKTQPGGSSSPYSYGAGWHFVGSDAKRYHTIMAYYTDGTYNDYQPCNLFSSPGLTWKGVPAGHAVDADNARLIGERKGALAAFRSPAAQSVTVDFDAQSGTVSPALSTCIPGTAYGYLPTPFRAGHTFDGWHTAPNGGGVKITKDSIVPSADTTLYASWLNGWNDDFANAAIISGASGSAAGANVGATSQTGEPSHDGSGHSVWWQWTAPDAGLYRFDTVGSSFDTVIAVYTGSAVSSLAQVAKNDNDASAGVNSSAVEFRADSGVVYHVAVDGKNSSGAIALNWKIAALQIDATGDVFSSEGAVGTISVTASGSWLVSHPIDAEWVSYDPQSGSGNAALQFTVAPNATGALRSTTLTFSDGTVAKTYEILENSIPWKTSRAAALSAAAAEGKKILLIAGRFTNNSTRAMRTVVCEREDVRNALKAGYVLWFSDWDGPSSEFYDYYSGMGSIYLPMICIIDPAHPSTYQDRTDNLQAADVFLARLINGANLITVTLDFQSGVGNVLSTTYAKLGAAYGELPAPDRAGYAFDGWNTAASGAGTPVTAQTTVAISVDHTLYAQWTPTGAASTVTFDAQDGNVSPASKTVYQGAAYDALPIPTRAAHLFAGWHTAANGGGSKVLSSTLVTATANHTLYAKWTPLSAGAIVYYVDAASGSDSASGTTPTTAKKTIQAAINLASSGDAILVLDGVYAPITTDNKAIAIQSVNGAEHTIIDGGDSQRCATLATADAHTDTVLTGFTLRNGRAYPDNGGGTYGGTINECIIINNYANHGGASAYGVLNRCKLVDNKALNWGGGSYYGTINNSLYLRNSGYYGGGSYYGTLSNCTIKDNVASASTNAGGGTRNSTVRNSIIWGNTSAGVANNGSSGTITYTCTTPLPSGAGNKNADPFFIDDEGRLAQNSPCKNAGSNSYAIGAFDLDGNARILETTVDMGAHEVVATPQSTSIPDTPVPVEYAWIDRYYDATTSADYIAIANGAGANGIPVWQSYVADLDPTDPGSKFEITGITFTNGVPYFTWSPDSPARVYETIGGATLDNIESWGPLETGSRFFRVKVSLP